jgi:hypothetical protein
MTRRHVDDEFDPACFDCALGAHDVCLEADPRPAGSRVCCCGLEDEVDPWAEQ